MGGRQWQAPPAWSHSIPICVNAIASCPHPHFLRCPFTSHGFRQICRANVCQVRVMVIRLMRCNRSLLGQKRVPSKAQVYYHLRLERIMLQPLQHLQNHHQIPKHHHPAHMSGHTMISGIQDLQHLHHQDLHHHSKHQTQ